MLRDKKTTNIIGEALYLPIVNAYDTHYLLKPTLQYHQVSESETYGRWLDYSANNLEKQVQLKIKSARWLVDKGWLGRNQNNRPNQPKKTNLPTHKFVCTEGPGPKDTHTFSNKRLSRKITKVYMKTTKMSFPTHNGPVALNERTLGLFTGFTLSTMINQKTALNTSLDNVYCSINITMT